eukprot:2677879-Lingulodinium_polyedra.AAC.1
MGPLPNSGNLGRHANAHTARLLVREVEAHNSINKTRAQPNNNDAVGTIKYNMVRFRPAPAARIIA